MSALRGGAWCVSAVMAGKWKTSCVLDDYANFYEHVMQALVHCWLIWTANGIDYIKKHHFVAKNLLCRKVL